MCPAVNVISPCTSELPGLIPDLLQQWIILDNDGVLDEAALGGGGTVAVVNRGRHTAGAEGDVEGGLKVQTNFSGLSAPCHDR